MTSIYNTSTGETTDLSIMIDGIDIAGDVLGNMGIGRNSDGITRVDEDDTSTPENNAAIAAGCHWYGDGESVNWWVDYVTGYRATIIDIAEAREELSALDDDALDAIAKAIGLGSQRPGEHIGAIIESLSDDAVEYDAERGAFVANFSALHEEIAKHA